MQFFIADAVSASRCEYERGAGLLSPKNEGAGQLCWKHKWLACVFVFRVSANACAIAYRDDKHEALNKNHDPKGEAATQPSECRRRANLCKRWMWL